MKQFLLIICFLCNGVNCFAQHWDSLPLFPGNARDDGVGFSINNKGFVGTGVDYTFTTQKDLWQYDPISNQWEQKADLPGIARQYASAFVINYKAYLCAGVAAGNVFLNDLWQYEPASDTWTQRASFPHGTRRGCIAFTIGKYGYFGLGGNKDSVFNDLWRYDPEKDNWLQVASLPGPGRWRASAFVVQNKAYVLFGRTISKQILKEMWEYSAENNTWKRLADFPGRERIYASAASTPLWGFVGLGIDSTNQYHADAWKFNGQWKQLPDLTNGPRKGAACFSVGENVTIAAGINNSGRLQDVWNLIPINENKNDAVMSVFYLPNSKELAIRYLRPSSIGTIAIFNASGHLIEKNTVASEPRGGLILLPLGELPVGAYFVSFINANNEIYNGKVMVLP